MGTPLEQSTFPFSNWEADSLRYQSPRRLFSAVLAEHEVEWQN